MYLYRVHVYYDTHVFNLFVGSQKGTFVRAIVRDAMRRYQIPFDAQLEIKSELEYDVPKVFEVLRRVGNGYFDGKFASSAATDGLVSFGYIKYKFRAEKIDTLMELWK